MKIHGDGTWNYDFICSLGIDCSCAMYLQGTGLRTSSGPFDWLTKAGFSERAELVASGFEGFLRKDDLRPVSRGTGAAYDPRCDAYVNEATGLLFLHDFPAGVPLEESFPEIKEKYDRRIRRFEERLRAAERSLLVWVSRRMPMSDDVVVAGCARITGRYGRNIDFLFIENDSSMPPGKCEEHRPAENIRRLRVDMTGSHPVMGNVKHVASLFADYNLTDSGKAYSTKPLDRNRLVRDFESEERNRRKKKRSRNLKKHMRSILCAVRWLPARLRRRRYANVLMLGYNCELAFRAVCSWGGVDSGVFSWSACVSLDGLIAALRGFDNIGRCGWKPFKTVNPLHYCSATNVGFHGRAPAERLAPGGVIDEAAIAEDRRELESRLEHLKEKFLRQLREDRSTLVVYKAWTKDCVPGISEKIIALKRELEAMGGRSFELLVVCERKAASAFDGVHPEFMLRTVEAYNPNDDVTARRLGDPSGWRLLFAEFAPETVKGRGKSFKFDHR